MLADDDMATGLIVHTDVDDGKDNSYLQPIWCLARVRIELGAPHVDDDKGVEDGYDPIHGR